jgi:hypothetical protein
MRKPVIASWIVLAFAAACLAQSSGPVPAENPATNQASDASIHGYGDRDKTCLAWTDTCRACERGDGDAISCSNIGIACQPAQIICSSRKPEPAK